VIFEQLFACPGARKERHLSSRGATRAVPTISRPRIFGVKLLRAIEVVHAQAGVEEFGDLHNLKGVF